MISLDLCTLVSKLFPKRERVTSGLSSESNDWSAPNCKFVNP